MSVKSPVRNPFEVEAILEKLRIQNRQMLVCTIGMVAFNIVIFTLFADSWMGPIQRFRASISGGFLGTPILGFLLAFWVAKLEYKGLTYWEKYFPSAVKSIFFITGIQFALSVLLVARLIWN